MKSEIKVPSMGESVTSGIINAWCKQNGETVSPGETLFELETEKTTLQVPSPVSGTLQILVQAGTQVAIGQTVGILTDVKAAGESAAPGAAQQPSAAEAPATGGPPAEAAPAAQQPPAAAEPAESAAEKWASTEAPLAGGAEAVKPLRRAEGRTERIAMSLIRKKTAERLVQAQHTAAYLTTFNEIDMQKVIDIRTHYKQEFQQEHGTKIGFMSFFVKACCQALREFPAVNAQLEGNDIIYQHFYDIGVAISIEEGLLVPVIRNADTMHFAQIEAAVADFAQRAGQKKIVPDELTGGTFTITNGGVFGSLLSTPIPAYPQTAILGMHAIKKRPVVMEDQIVIRPMMYVALSYDHRVIDGRQAIGFLGAVKNYIEEPDKLLLEL
jgi:2-oxoglutarate dehydrogenase E2 component (dihydrolipoamide succinyltransferase)